MTNLEQIRQTASIGGMFFTHQPETHRVISPSPEIHAGQADEILSATKMVPAIQQGQVGP